MRIVGTEHVHFLKSLVMINMSEPSRGSNDEDDIVDQEESPKLRKL